LSNRSSGKMGHAVASAALRRGAEVVLISGPTTLQPPPGAVYVPVQTAEEMREASLQHLASASVVIKAAAVADYRVERPSATKIKSGGKDEGLTLSLVANPDILKELAQRKGGAFLVGFAAETNDVRKHAADKLRAKGVDLLVVNDVSQQGIGSDAELAAQERALQGCPRCKLSKSRSTVVFGSGNPRARFVVIGEGPGEEEDKQGKPFVGRAGQLLTKMLASVKFDRERDCYICNVVKCRPERNRN